MVVSMKNKSDKYEAIIFIVKISLSIVLAIDFVYFFLKSMAQFVFDVESIITESIIVYLPLISIVYVVLFVGDQKKVKKVSLIARKLMHSEELFCCPQYAFYIIMIPCSIIFGASSVLYRKIIGGTATSKWEILILCIFSLFSMVIVYRKIFPFIYRPSNSGDSVPN